MRILPLLMLTGLLGACGDKDAEDDTALPDVDGDGFNAGADCQDEDPTVFPGAPERCNSGDDDCDDAVDEGAWQVVYSDSDGDGHGAGGGRGGACVPAAGESVLGDDCDDTSAARYPGAVEVCDGLDNDCDVDVDEEPEDGVLLYSDADADGFGDDATGSLRCPTAGTSEVGGDCDDTDPTAHPGGQEICDGADNDCDGNADDESASDVLTWLPDADDDGWGIDAPPLVACFGPSGYTEDVDGRFDCDDGDPGVNPGAVEICDDGLDNDCDQSVGSCRATGSAAMSAARDAAFSGDDDNDHAGDRFAGSWGDDGADGFHDVALGAPRAEGRLGKAYVFRGGATPPANDWRASEADAVIIGDAAGDELGTAVAWGGDLDGDGRDDLLLGAPLADVGGTGGGVALLFAGPLSDGYASDATWSLVGSSTENVGEVLCAAGDLNGDGHADFAVGAPGWTNGKGRVYVLHGPSGTGDDDIDQVAVVLSGTARGEGQDMRLAGGRDGDGDGLDDLLLGQPDDSYDARATGLAVIFAGPISADANFSAGITLFGVGIGDEAGAAVAWAGDTNGDGYADLLIGAPEAPGGGEAYLVLGPVTADFDLAGADATLPGAAGGDRVGASVGGAGDIDGDGLADWVVGAPGRGADAGEVGVAYGETTPSNPTFTGLPLLLSGGAAGDALGEGVGGVGDIDGDGHGDVAFAAPYREAGADQDAGTLYLWLGQGW